MQKISSYILTFNSEKYLEIILSKIDKISDEIIILDSGSNDNTKNIVEKFHKAIFQYRKFDNYIEQRNYAASLCSNDTIFFVDSDEIPDDELIENIQKLKEEGIPEDTAYSIDRIWYALNKKVHCLYPVISPDCPARIFNKKYASFGIKSNLVHESLYGYLKNMKIKGSLNHYTFNSREELFSKIDNYTNLAASDLINNKKHVGLINIYFNPFVIFIKWYFFNRGFIDGRVGFILSCYAYKYTKEKYIKAYKLKNI